MRSLSSVVKAERVKLNGGVCRLPLYHVHPGNDEGGVIPAAPQNILPKPQVIEHARKRAEEIVAETEKRREEILAAAGRESDEMMLQAEMHVLALEEEAKKAGYDSGYLEGMAEGQREGNRLRREGEAQLESAKALRNEMLERIEPQVVQLAVDIAEKLMGTQLNESPETVVAMVREVLRQVRETGEVLVRLHPQDLPLCRDKLGELQAELRDSSVLTLIADGALQRGNCRVETNGAVIECLLDERVTKLRQVLSEVSGHELS